MVIYLLLIRPSIDSGLIILVSRLLKNFLLHEMLHEFFCQIPFHYLFFSVIISK